MSAQLLVVDDDPVTVDLLKEVLSKEGYQVKTALSGEEAARLATEDVYDLVVTDVRMGDMDGMEVLRAFKKISPETISRVVCEYFGVDVTIIWHTAKNDLPPLAAPLRRLLD